MMKYAVFSGRFDPGHLGHVKTMVLIAHRFDHVIIPILDYPERMVPAKVVKMVLESLFQAMSPLNNVTFVINDIHFGKITEQEYIKFIYKEIGSAVDVTYLSGNPEVIAHFKNLGLKHEFFERSMDEIYTGTNIRREIIDNGYI